MAAKTSQRQLRQRVLQLLEGGMCALTRATEHLADSNVEPAALACLKAKASIDRAATDVASASFRDAKVEAQLAMNTKFMARALWVIAKETNSCTNRPGETLRFLLNSFIIEGGAGLAEGDLGVGRGDDASLQNV